MRNLPVPDREKVHEHLQKSIYTYVYAKKELGHNITQDEIEAILALYDLYDNSLGNAKEVFKGAALLESLRIAVKHAYGHTYEGKALHSIRTELFSNAKLCPICGIEPPSQLDHHLPTSVFHILSIYVRNLIPLCDKCNKRKLAGFGDADGIELNFVHAYLDILPDVQFLRAKIEIQDKSLVVVFEIDKYAGLSEDYSTRLARQIEKLELNPRYQKEVNTYISGHAVTIQSFFSVGGAALVKNWLTATARHERNAFYQNHWRPTLLDALSAHDDFVNGGFAQILPVDQNIMNDFLGKVVEQT